MNKIISPKPRIAVLFVLAFVSLVVIVVINNMEISRSPLSPTWNGITPGVTNLQEAISLLGPPDEIENSISHSTRASIQYFENAPNHQIYIYEEKINDWNHVELWTDNIKGEDIVMAILLTMREIKPDEPINLDSLIESYGRPEEVTWTFFPNTRYLIWAKHGLAVSADADLNKRQNGVLATVSWSEISVGEVIYFVPMPIGEVLKISWPWPNNGAGWASNNPFQSENLDFTGGLPKDPYDWDSQP